MSDVCEHAPATIADPPPSRVRVMVSTASISPGREPDPIEDLEELIYLRAADLIAQWERADPRDCWRHTGEQPPRAVGIPATVQPYRTPQATIDAFWYVVGLCNPVQLTTWLDNHPQDAAFLLKLLEGK